MFERWTSTVGIATASIASRIAIDVCE